MIKLSKRSGFFHTAKKAAATEAKKSFQDSDIKFHGYGNGETYRALQAQLARDVQKQETEAAMRMKAVLLRNAPTVAKNGQFSQSTTSSEAAAPTAPSIVRR